VTTRPDDRIWITDFNEIMDWEAVGKASMHHYGNEATWWTQATEGVNYYRAEMPARHLPGRTVRLEARDLIPRDDDGEPYMPRQIGDNAVWMFPGNDTRALCMAQLHMQGHKVMVEVDDNYLTAPPIPGLSSWRALRDPMDPDVSSYGMHRKIVTSWACDGVIVSTPKLWEVYSQIHPNVHVCMNCIDPEDWQPDPPHQKDGILRIGWAGSASHGYDIAEIKQGLSWAAQQKNVEVVLLGELSLPFKHRNVPWTTSLAQYRRNVQELDVMLCPLRPSDWADCKSDVKALEGVMGGALPVVSHTEPYSPWWDRGYVAERRRDWLRIIKHLVGNRDEVRQAWQDAYAYVLAERTIEKGIEAWRTALA